jgi:hypothetical protein
MADFMEQWCLGGPGHDGYAFDADVFCVPCGKAIMRKIAAETPENVPDPSVDPHPDTDDWPAPIFFGESDCTQHCARCGDYLYGPEQDGEA